MKATIVEMNKTLAEKYLAKNKNNRRMNTKYLTYADEMRKGKWKENGESIIIDRNGVIKDGQHRLQATIAANHRWLVPIVSDVEPNVMDTIDTGKNRSLSDVLEINGFTSTSLKASLIKQFILIERGVTFYNGTQSNVRKDKMVNSDQRYVSNSEGILYAKAHAGMLEDIVSQAYKLWSKQPIRIYTQTEVGVFLYLLTKGNNVTNALVNSFVKLVLGVNSDENSSASWFYKKMVKYKTSKEKVKNKWVIAMFIKCWNLYINGNPPVRSLSFDIKNQLPKIETLTTVLND